MNIDDFARKLDELEQGAANEASMALEREGMCGAHYHEGQLVMIRAVRRMLRYMLAADEKPEAANVQAR